SLLNCQLNRQLNRQLDGAFTLIFHGYLIFPGITCNDFSVVTQEKSAVAVSLYATPCCRLHRSASGVPY
ncbi:MAG: hypothetical protein AAFV46_11030, partial [Cyanobacteria bacterium J06635_11]